MTNTIYVLLRNKKRPRIITNYFSLTLSSLQILIFTFANSEEPGETASYRMHTVCQSVLGV